MPQRASQPENLRKRSSSGPSRAARRDRRAGATDDLGETAEELFRLVIREHMSVRCVAQTTSQRWVIEQLEQPFR
jgi:hypothetical protein